MKRRTLLYLLLAVTLVLALMRACGTCNTSSQGPTTVVEAVTQALDSTSAGVNMPLGAAPPPKIARNEGEKKADERRQEVLKKKIEESPFKNAVVLSADGPPKIDCEAILKTYEEEVNASLREQKVTAGLIKIDTDPILNACKTNPCCQQRFEELEEKLADGLAKPQKAKPVEKGI